MAGASYGKHVLLETLGAAMTLPQSLGPAVREEPLEIAPTLGFQPISSINAISPPQETFQLDGESSGLLGKGSTKWPFGGGYAFTTWLYIESFQLSASSQHAAAETAAAAAANTVVRQSPTAAAAAAAAALGGSEVHMPRVFSFLSADGEGLEAYFNAQFLVVETCGRGGKRASLHFRHQFDKHTWYCVGIEHEVIRR